MTITDYLKQRAQQVEQVIDQLLPGSHREPEIIHDAMRYSCLGGGKRLRAILALAACEAVNGSSETKASLIFGGALEMIHAYSLIHDDLSCMDDDDFRRGKPTNHKVFGEAIAVLAGDALLSQAMEVLTKLPTIGGVPDSVALQIFQEVTTSIGSQGLIGGQVLDMVSEGKPIDGTALRRIHALKTGKLFEVALRGGALIGGATEQELALVTEYAHQFGLAFQITDDILDVIGDEVKLGKAVGADAKHAKATYPSLYGLETAKKMAAECVTKCQQASASLPENNWALAQLAQFVVDREF